MATQGTCRSSGPLGSLLPGGPGCREAYPLRREVYLRREAHLRREANPRGPHQVGDCAAWAAVDRALDAALEAAQLLRARLADSAILAAIGSALDAGAKAAGSRVAPSDRSCYAALRAFKATCTRPSQGRTINMPLQVRSVTSHPLRRKGLRPGQWNWRAIAHAKGVIAALPVISHPPLPWYSTRGTSSMASSIYSFLL